VKVSRVRVTSYLGRACTTWVVNRSGRRGIGERVVVFMWHDSGDIDLRHCRGDGRISSFVIYEERTLRAGTDAVLYVNEIAGGMLNG
jgi:hypothetical protein